MKVIKKTAQYTVYQKRSGRYGVKDASKNWVNEAEKVSILLAEDLIKAPTPKAPEPEVEEAAEEAAAEEEAAPESEAEAEAEQGEAEEESE